MPRLLASNSIALSTHLDCTHCSHGLRFNCFSNLICSTMKETILCIASSAGRFHGQIASFLTKRASSVCSGICITALHSGSSEEEMGGPQVALFRKGLHVCESLNDIDSLCIDEGAYEMCLGSHWICTLKSHPEKILAARVVDCHSPPNQLLRFSTLTGRTRSSRARCSDEKDSIASFVVGTEANG